jgi:hypothetical protein
MLHRLPAVIAALSALTGCALFHDDELTPSMDRLVGHPVTEVAVILGPPARHSDAGDGRRVFQWERYGGTVQTAGLANQFAGPLTDAAPQAHQSQCQISVTATPRRPRTRPSALGDWTVQSWDANGTNCH